MKTLPDARMREHFLGWQCRIRQHAMRFEGYAAEGTELSQEEVASAKFFVCAFEMDTDVAKSDKFGPNDMLNRREFFANSLDEVSVILASLGTSLCNLDLPWKSEFPLE